MRARASDRAHRMFTLAANRTAVKADRRRTAILVTAMDAAPWERRRDAVIFVVARFARAGGTPAFPGGGVRPALGLYALVSLLTGASSAVRTARAQ